MNELIVREEPGLPEITPKPLAPATAATLTRAQKAAIIVSILDADAAVNVLSSFDEATLSRLATAVMGIQAVTADVMEEVVEEFLFTLGDGSGVRGGLDQARKLLSGVLDDPTLERLLDKITNPDKGMVWDRFSNVPATESAYFLQLEHPQTIAFVISRLRTDRAAGILESMNRDLAQEVVNRLSRVAAPADEVIEQIEEVISNEFLSVINERSSAVKPAEMIGNLMNNVSSAVREAFLEDLQNNDANLAQEVMRVMFTFADVTVRVVANDVPKIIKDFEEEKLILALRHARDNSNPSYDFITGAISKRLAERILEEVEALDQFKPKEAEAAQMEFVKLVQQKAKQGEITLIEIEPD